MYYLVASIWWKDDKCDIILTAVSFCLSNLSLYGQYSLGKARSARVYKDRIAIKHRCHLICDLCCAKFLWNFCACVTVLLTKYCAQIPLARSELHLTELLEDVCNHMSDYGESDSSNGNRNFIRTSVRDGSGIKLDNLQISASLHSQLKFAVCFNTV